MAMSFLSAMVGLIMVEFILSMIPSSPNSSIEAAARKAGRWDTRKALDVVTDLRAQGKSANPMFYPELLNIHGNEIYPLATQSSSTQLFCNESGHWVWFESDEHGFRNPEGMYETAIDVALIGDSFAQGYCVEKDISHYLREYYPKTINWAYAANGPLLELATIREFVEPLHPRIVLWLYFEANDFADLLKESKTVLSKYLLPDHQVDLINIQEQVDNRIKEIVETRLERERVKNKPVVSFLLKSIGKIRSVAVLAETRTRLGLVENPDELSTEDFMALLPLFKKILTVANGAISGYGGEFYFVYLPAWQRFYQKNDTEFFYEQVILTVNNLSIPIIDIKDRFEREKDPLAFFPYRRAGHYNEKGYQAVAKTLLKRLEEDHRLRQNN